MSEGEQVFEYYDWARTLSYDAEVTVVVTARGRGKTYGIRKQAVQDWIRNGERFVEVCRYKGELAGVMASYFDRLAEDERFSEYVFAVRERMAWIAPKPEDGKKVKHWEPLGYFVALTEQQSLKKHTFNRVRRIIFDEAIMDKTDRLHRYLPREFDVLTNLVDTISRQRPGEETRCRVYLLGNAVDLVNPYFQRLGINRIPRYGFTWHNERHALLHYEEPGKWSAARAEGTLVGHMTGKELARTNFGNMFSEAGRGLLGNKPKWAKCQYGIVCEGVRFGIWYDWTNGLVFVNGRIPKEVTTFALTTSDNEINFLMVRRSDGVMRSLVELYCGGLMRFDSPSTLERFGRVLSMFGLRS